MEQKKNIADLNLMIAKFMGGTQTEWQSVNGFIDLPDGKDDKILHTSVMIDDLKYHSDITWQMPVIKKIHDMGFVVETYICLICSCRAHKGNFREPQPIIWFTHQANEMEEAIFGTITQTIEYINMTKLSDDRFSQRFTRLYNLGFGFNGEEFIYEDSETTKVISKAEVEELDTDHWNKYCTDLWHVNDFKRKRKNKIQLNNQLNETLLAAATNVVSHAKRSEDGKVMVIEPIKILQLEKIAYRITNGHKLKRAEEQA